MKKRFGVRFSAVLLSLLMIVSLLPIGVLTVSASAPASYTNISANSSASVNITSSGTSKYFRFIPEKNGTLTFYSSGSYDTYGYLLDASGNTLASDDDGGSGNNFSITYDVTAGTTYYLQARFYNSSSTGSFTVSVDSPTIVSSDNGLHIETNSQGDVFLGGRYLELGVSRHGSFGTSRSHTSSLFHRNTVGMIVDEDGWDTGNAPTTGDFFLPDTPEERYIFSYYIGSNKYEYIVADRQTILSGTWKEEPTAQNDSTDDTLRCIVTGVTTHDVRLTLTYSFGVNDKAFKTDVLIENEGSNTISQVRFVRSFDPDQDDDKYDTNYTYNKVICNPSSDSPASKENYAMVVARGARTLSGFFFISFDNRARASQGVSFAPSSAYLPGLWQDSASLPTFGTEDRIEMSKSATNGYSLDDTGIAITFSLGSVAPEGKDNFSYYSSLDPEINESVIKVTEAVAPTIVSANSIVLPHGYTYGEISVSATTISGQTLSYQWYRNSVNTTEGGTLIPGAVSAAYSIPLSHAPGASEYYYCIVTATRNDNHLTASTTTNVLEVSYVGDHEPSEMIIDEAPDCVKNGRGHIYCLLCNETLQTLSLPATGHTPGEWIEDSPATCTENGVKHQICEECEITLRTAYIPATGHNYAVTDSKAATCTESGYITYTCVNCPDTYTVTIYADHHYELAETHAATCTEAGHKLFRCSSCGAEYTETIPAGQHEYTSELIRQATTTETGLLRYTCVHCPDTYDVEVPMLKEGIQLLLVQDRNSWDTITNLTVLNQLVEDGYLAGWNVVKSSELATLDLSTYGIILLANDQYASSYSNLESVNAKLTSFVELGGVLIYGACDNGWTNGNITYTLPGGAKKGNYYSSRNYIVNAAHPVVTAAMTNGVGLTNEILYHNYCSHSYFTDLPVTAQIILQDSLGKPTLAEYPLGAGQVILNGLTWEHAYHYLTYFSSYSFATRVYDDLIIYASTFAGAHTHTYDAGITVLPNCTEQGYTLHTCSECGHTFRDNFVPAIGHTPGNWIDAFAPTCESNGEKHQICSECSEVIQTEIIPALGHDFAYTSTIDPTCTDDGYVLYTCTRDGCGETKRDVILAFGHNYGDDNVCDRCGHTLPYIHTHKYSETIVAPTCSEMGYTLYTCPCGASYKDHYVEPHGHTWNEGTVTTPKTCTSDGLITYTCTECSATCTEIVPAGHTWVEGIVRSATCTVDGEMQRTCAECGYVESVVIPAGHHWDEGEITADPDCTNAGAKICHCTECSAEQVFEIPALGHNFYCGVCQRCGIKFIDIVNENLAHPEYGMYFEIDDIVSNYGPDLINEYGVLLDYNSDATLDKVAVYLTQDGTMWRRCIACTGDGITYATYVPYLSYGEDIKYTGLNSDWINTFRLQENADGIWNYSNYATIGVNLEDRYGNLLLSLYNIGKAGAKTRVFDDLDEMIAWLSPDPAHIHVHSFGAWEPVASAGGDTVTQLKQTCTCGETRYKNIQTIFYTNTVSGAFNDTVDVDIYLQADSYLADLQLTFLYNSEIFDVTSVTFSPSLGGMKNATVSPADSKFSLVYSNPELLTEDTVIATVTLKIKKNVIYQTGKAFWLADDGTYNSCHTFFDSTSYVTEPHFASGFGNVAILGPDPNGDGELNIFDLFLMLSTLSDPAYDPHRADLLVNMDCNKDGVFDIADITYLQFIVVSMN